MISLLLLATLSLPALAHMEMSYPYPLHSKFNPATPEAIKDYSMTNPLDPNTPGQYPCKGYINNPESGMDSVATWDAGSTIGFTLAGTAVHGGGSCQVSMSYDLGNTWNVIQSYMGGCPIDSSSYDVEIPKEAPSGEALFAWGWFNFLGNREMYHNCAAVTITNGGSGLDSSRFPAPFLANVAEAPTCKTIEGVSVVFPNPGSVVKYGGEYKDSRPTTPAGFTGDCGSTVAPPTPSSSSSAADAGPTNGAAVSTSAPTVSTSFAPPPAVSSSTPSQNGTTPNESSTKPGKCKRSSRSKRSAERIARRHERLLRRSQHEHSAALQDRDLVLGAGLYSS